MAEPLPADPSKLRVSDSERERVIALLQSAASEGRLTLSEFSERSEAVYAARTRGELDRFVDDLPVTPEHDEHAGFGRRSGSTEGTVNERRFNAIMGDTDERLVGEIAETQRVLAVMGDVTLDLRDAALPSGRIFVTGTVVMGGVRIIVPDGIKVRTEGVNVMGDVKTRVDSDTSGQVPTLHVKMTNVMGEVRIVDDTHHNKYSRWKRWWRGRRD